MSCIVHFEVFLLTGILLNITPGNDTIYILSKTIGQGRKAGIASVLGIATGSLVHTSLAALGLSVIIAQSILLFNIVKYAGAAYLVYLGIKMLMDKSELDTNLARAGQSSKLLKIYRDGVLTNILNPKVALFFIAFLPQFIDPAYRTDIVPFLLLGISFTFTGTLWCLLLVVFAAGIFKRLKSNKHVSNYINKICGTVLIMLGIKVALAGKN